VDRFFNEGDGMIGQEVRRGEVVNYPFNILEGDGKLTDISGNQLHATIVGATPTTDHRDRANRAYSFPTADKHITIGADVMRTGIFVLEFAFMTTQSGVLRNIIQSGTGGTVRTGIQVGISAANLLFIHTRYGTPGSAPIYTFTASTGTIEINTWYHGVAIAVPGLGNGYMELIMDGVSVGSTNTAQLNESRSNDALWTVGSYNGSSMSLFGSLDLLKMSSVVPLQSECTQLYNNWRK